MEFNDLSPHLKASIQMALERASSDIGSGFVHDPRQRGPGQSALSDVLSRDFITSDRNLKAIHLKDRRIPQTGLFWGIVRNVDLGFPDKPESHRGLCEVECPDLYGKIYARPMSKSFHFIFDQVTGGNTDTVTGDHELPQVNDEVLVAFIQTPISATRNMSNGIILGIKPSPIHDKLLLDKNGQPEPLKRIDVHPSFQWRKTNAKGDLELKFPDGTFVAVQEAPGSTPPSAANDLTENRNPVTPAQPKTLTISHVSGAWIRITADGTIELHNPTTGPPQDMKIFSNGNFQLNCDGDATINAGGNVDATAAGNASVVATAGDVDVKATAGNATLEAGGNVDVKALAGDATVEAINVDVNASAKVTITSPVTEVIPMIHVHTSAAPGFPTSPPTGTIL